MIITSHAFARAGLIGNPSDGYYGKTISFVIRNFKATVRLLGSPILKSSRRTATSPASAAWPSSCAT